jgi:cardiolipin synthase
LNQEANLNVLDSRFGADQARMFAEDRAHSRRVTLEDWRHRPVRERIQERFAWVMQKQL